MYDEVRIYLFAEITPYLKTFVLLNYFEVIKRLASEKLIIIKIRGFGIILEIQPRSGCERFCADDLKSSTINQIPTSNIESSN